MFRFTLSNDDVIHWMRLSLMDAKWKTPPAGLHYINVMELPKKCRDYSMNGHLIDCDLLDDLPEPEIKVEQIYNQYLVIRARRAKARRKNDDQN